MTVMLFREIGHMQVSGGVRPTSYQLRIAIGRLCILVLRKVMCRALAHTTQACPKSYSCHDAVAIRAYTVPHLTYIQSLACSHCCGIAVGRSE